MDSVEDPNFQKMKLIVNLGKHVVTYVAIVACVFMAFMSIKELSGKETNAAIDVNFSAEASLNGGGDETDSLVAVVESSFSSEKLFLDRYRYDELLTYGVLFSTIIVLYILYRREKWLRLTKTEALSAQIKFLEDRFDPERSSSELTIRGETNPEDL
ncbi:hypothetical protein BGP77_11540 [Saccharospirillum sp. MSK14-1]|uniref:hypothetical protein n=1 Tax=Saccharospirillum sp. MSK14-1 TaxID=1897632 RepID=UPI000D393A5A|nr:hypothetical protein [Saccharospirillum sp. MSK14-1]PTY38573.1 hypothetical protein BGP77_11540 [Saccharospirillum sp. MSK14-1]